MGHKKLFFIIAFACTSLLPAAYCDSIAIIASKNAPFAQSVVDQIDSNLKQAASGVTVDKFYTEDGDPVIAVQKKQYKAICVIGSIAGKIAQALPDTPVIFSMAMEASTGELNNILKKENINVTGVYLSPQPDRQVEIISKVLPSIKSIYLFHDGVSAEICAEIVKLPTSITMNTQEIENANKVPAALSALNTKPSDALWLLPDSTIYNKDSIAFILNYSIEKRLPIIGFSASIVKAGAVLGYVFDYNDISKQTVEIIIKIINGATPMDIPPQRARKTGYALNLKIAEHLGIKIEPDIIKDASEIIK